MSEYHYPCDGAHRETVPDYYPLSLDDITYLLRRAQALEDVRGRASIQIRLTQGIPGQTCPHPLPWGNAVGAAMVEVERRYMEFVTGEEPQDIATVAQAIAQVIGSIGEA